VLSAHVGCVWAKTLRLNITPKGLQATANYYVGYAPASKEITVYISRYQKVFICHSKRETETRTADIQTVNKAALAYHFEYQSC